jgi:hypothetical protein
MSNDALEGALKSLAHRQPFRPFPIEFLGGDRLPVAHPEAVRRYGDLFLHQGPDGSHRLFDGAGVCQLLDPPPVQGG